MADVSEYIPTKIRNTLGKTTDLPSPSTRSTAMSKLKTLVLNAKGTANLANAYGAAQSSIPLTTTVMPGAMTTDDRFLYVCSDAATPAKIDKIEIDNFTQVYSTLDLSALVTRLFACEIVGRKLYVVTDTNPADVVRVDLDSFTVDSVLTLATPNAICIKSDGTSLYIGNANAATIISKVDIETFTEIVAPLNTGFGSGTYSLELDDVYLYVIDKNDPTAVTRVILSSFTVESTLQFVAVAQSATGSCIRGTYLYISAWNGKLLQIDLNKFTVASTLVLTTSSVYNWGCALGSTGTYLIMIGAPASGSNIITYIDLATFTEFGTYELPANNNLFSFAIDGSFCYFGLADGTIFRKYIQPITPVESRMVDNIQSNLSSIDTDITALQADITALQADITALQADIGNASASTLGSIYGILGNPGATFTASIAALALNIDNIEAAIVNLQADVGNASASTLGSLTNILGNPATDLATTIDTIKGLVISTDAAGTHDITTVNDKTETDVVEINVTTRYGLSIYFDLNALVAAAEGGTVTIRMYNKIDETTYREIATATFIVGTTTTHPSFEAMRLNHNTKFTIQCSTDVTNTRTINYRYITDPKE